MSYALSAKAEQDIVEIYISGFEQFGQAQADRYHAHLWRCFEFLADNPLIARERFEITPPVRIHPVGAHIIIYRIEDGGKLSIIRVRHAHEDWQTSEPG